LKTLPALAAPSAQQVLHVPANGYTLFLGNNGPSAVTLLLQKNAGFADPCSMGARRGDKKLCTKDTWR
jgi:hypothetical protein